jgi:hypothetical protein
MPPVSQHAGDLARQGAVEETDDRRPRAANWTLVQLRASARLRYDPDAPDEFQRGGRAVERYDLIIVGGGAAGINALKAAVAMKARVALVDRGPLGGTCVNRG